MTVQCDELSNNGFVCSINEHEEEYRSSKNAFGLRVFQLGVYIQTFVSFESRDSSVGIATRLRVGPSGF
jgi:hypothetical protein